MNRKYSKEDVLEFLKNNKEKMIAYFMRGDFDFCKEEHLKIFHAIEAKR